MYTIAIKYSGNNQTTAEEKWYHSDMYFKGVITILVALFLFTGHSHSIM